MHLDKLVSAQITQHLPLTAFRRCVARYDDMHRKNTDPVFVLRLAK